MSGKTHMELIQAGRESLAPEARQRWNEQMMESIWRSTAPDLGFTDFSMFLALASKYNLDPFAREIWGARGSGSNGQPGRTLIMVGRDGLLTVARRSPDFVATQGDVVRANDEFEVTHTINAEGEQVTQIMHKIKGGKEARGPLIGSYAQVLRRDPKTGERYFTNYVFCDIDEYKPNSPHPRSSWATNETAMCAKTSVSLATRLAYGISGVLGEAEAEKILYDGGDVSPIISREKSIEEMVSLAPESQRDRFRRVLRESDQIRPGSITLAGVQLTLSGVDEYQWGRWLDDQEQANIDADGHLDRDEEITDAEVVE